MAYKGTYETNLPQYDYLRQRAKSEASAQEGEQQDALARRFAALGQQNSGAAIKASQMTSEASQKNLADTQAQIGFAEQNELSRRAEQEKQKEFQSQEAETGRQFQSKEAETQRLFSKDLFNQDMEFKKQVQAQNVHFAELDNAFREKEFGENVKTNEFNKLVSMWQSGAISPHDISTRLQWAQQAGFSPGSMPAVASAPSPATPAPSNPIERKYSYKKGRMS